ncbi:sulfotransferase [Pseudomaricurvus alcaniphilus]|uniref:sulfotransferase family protein n=1 Tax=Pseudomaricurvus alcaniphilus TaxID=1166482 RepID=UPI00140C304F|nr:sulfotransferase [Pseudomaricurvus alcaniphilus]NHN36469.1 sulfotransferase [Pseudomaricurvus alcaniphilus]
MYFDLDYYCRVLRHVWSLQQWPGRRKMLVRLLLLVPLATAFHALCFVLDYVFFPRLWRQQVRQPVFIVGHARSGSTLIHRLLAADGETFSYFLYWETFFPSLLQKKVIRAIGWIDQHCFGSPIKKRLQQWDEKKFGKYRHIHNMSLWNSEEDQFVMRAAFVTQQWALDVPMMDVIDLFHVDQMPERKKRRWMRHYRECIKRQLLLNGGNRIHLSKNPLLSGWVESLIETFPDARFAVVMRDPTECIPSVLKLVEVNWGGKGWRRKDYDASLRTLTQVSFDTFRQPREVLARHPQTPQVVIDYRELTSQPRTTVHAVYRAFGMSVTPAFDAWLRAQEEKERSHNSPFQYSIDDYELSRGQIETELSDFFNDFNWPRESPL